MPESHFSRSHSFGMNTGMSLIHYPMLTREKTAELQEVDLRAGGLSPVRDLAWKVATELTSCPSISA